MKPWGGTGIQYLCTQYGELVQEAAAQGLGMGVVLVPPFPMDRSLEPSGLWVQAASLGFQTASMGPRVALEDSGVAFWPEEVTEMGGCFQEGPGSIWKGWTLRPRVSRGLGHW